MSSSNQEQRDGALAKKNNEPPAEQDNEPFTKKNNEPPTKQDNEPLTKRNNEPLTKRNNEPLTKRNNEAPAEQNNEPRAKEADQGPPKHLAGEDNDTSSKSAKDKEEEKIIRIFFEPLAQEGATDLSESVEPVEDIDTVPSLSTDQEARVMVVSGDWTERYQQRSSSDGELVGPNPNNDAAVEGETAASSTTPKGKRKAVKRSLVVTFKKMKRTFKLRKTQSLGFDKGSVIESGFLFATAAGEEQTIATPEVASAQSTGVAQIVPTAKEITAANAATTSPDGVETPRNEPTSQDGLVKELHNDQTDEREEQESSVEDHEVTKRPAEQNRPVEKPEILSAPDDDQAAVQEQEQVDVESFKEQLRIMIISCVAGSDDIGGVLYKAYIYGLSIGQLGGCKLDQAGQGSGMVKFDDDCAAKAWKKQACDMKARFNEQAKELQSAQEEIATLALNLDKAKYREVSHRARVAEADQIIAKLTSQKRRYDASDGNLVPEASLEGQSDDSENLNGNVSGNDFTRSDEQPGQTPAVPEFGGNPQTRIVELQDEITNLKAQVSMLTNHVADLENGQQTSSSETGAPEAAAQMVSDVHTVSEDRDASQGDSRLSEDNETSSEIDGPSPEEIKAFMEGPKKESEDIDTEVDVCVALQACIDKLDTENVTLRAMNDKLDQEVTTLETKATTLNAQLTVLQNWLAANNIAPLPQALQQLPCFQAKDGQMNFELVAEAIRGGTLTPESFIDVLYSHLRDVAAQKKEAQKGQAEAEEEAFQLRRYNEYLRNHAMARMQESGISYIENESEDEAGYNFEDEEGVIEIVKDEDHPDGFRDMV